MREYFHPTLGRWFAQRDDGTWTYRYRLIIEMEIGRRLRTDEHVHHINGDSADDRRENLLVMGESEHHLHHGALNRAALAANPGPWARDYPCCIECGTTERPHTGHGQCSRCYFRNLSRAKRGGSPRKPAIVVTKDCPWCGEEFTRRGADNVTAYCSEPCARQGGAARAWEVRRARGTDRGWKRPNVSERMRGQSPTKRVA